MKQKIYVTIGIICYVIVFCVCDVDRLIPGMLLILALIATGSICFWLGIKAEESHDSDRKERTEQTVNYAEEFQKLYYKTIIYRLFGEGGESAE